MNNIKNIAIAFVLGIFIISSCGKDNQGREMNEYLSSFIKNNDSIIVFGYADLNQILDKTNYQKDSKLKAILGSQVSEFRAAIDEKSPVYFALKGPLDSNKNLQAAYVFLDVKNHDSLMKSLNQSGFDFTEAGDMKYHQDGDVTIGIQKELAIVITKGGKYDGKQLLTTAFGQCTGDLSGGKVDAILEEKGDIVFGTNLSTLFNTSNTDLSDLPEERRNELKAMVNDSYVQTAFHFDKGSANIETKHLFNEDLKRRLFFKSDKNAEILKYLGNGQPNIGISLNLDLPRLESLISDYSPETLEKIAEMIEMDPMMMKLLGGNNLLSSLADGNMGGLFFMDKQNFGFGFNMYLGLKDAGKSVFPFLEPKIPVAFTYDYIESGVRAYTLETFAPIPDGEVRLPEGCDVFGKKGFTAFVNLSDFSVEDFGLQGGAEVLTIVKYMTFELDENGSKLYIEAKDKNTNILEQGLTFFVDELKEKMGDMAL